MNEPSPVAQRAADNIWLLVAAYSSGHKPAQTRAAIAHEVQKALDGTLGKWTPADLSGPDQPGPLPRQPGDRCAPRPLLACLEEIISVLCAQPDIPMSHKTDMLNKLGALQQAGIG